MNLPPAHSERQDMLYCASDICYSFPLNLVKKTLLFTPQFVKGTPGASQYTDFGTATPSHPRWLCRGCQLDHEGRFIN